MEWNILLTVYLSLFIASPLIAILPELGHAFAYLAFTKPDNIDICIGSYGDQENSGNFRIGKLNFFIKKAFPFVRGIGLCMSSKRETDYRKFIIILLAGTVFTLIMAAIVTFLIVNTNADIRLKIGCYIFLGLSAGSLFANLVPYRLNSFRNFNDNSLNLNIESDGRQLLFTLKVKDNLPLYLQAQEDIQEKNYQAAADKLKQVFISAPGTERIIRQLVKILMQLKSYADAEIYAAQLITKRKPEIADILNIGCLQSLTGKHDEAIETYQKILKRDRKNFIALNNLGDEMVRKGAHKVAQHLLDRAIAIKPDSDYPYINLGHSKLLQGELAEGKLLIDKSISLNKQNASAYVYLALYYSKMGNQEEANNNLSKARELDPGVDTSDYNQHINQPPIKEMI